MSETTQTDRRGAMLLELMSARRTYTAEAVGYLRRADDDGACECDPEDACDCATWDRATALQAAQVAAQLAQAAALEAQALTAWWAQPSA